MESRPNKKTEELIEEMKNCLSSDVQYIPDPHIYLLKSHFKGRSPTVVFDYPPQCFLRSRVNENTIQKKSALTLTYRLSNGVHRYNSLTNALENAGFIETDSLKSHLCISTVPKVEVLSQLDPYQKINHFPGVWQLGRKDCLWRNICKAKRKHGLPYNICPQTYLLPEDYHRLQTERKRQENSLWILKPVALSCGKGIKVLSKDTQLLKRPGFVVSKYISNPHTIKGYKYDLRVYVCVTSFDPLRVYVYEDGLVRFATKKYSALKKNVDKKFVHLTNFSINKKSSRYIKNKDALSDGQSSKWSFYNLRTYFTEAGIDYDRVFGEIEDVVIKTLISVEPFVVDSLQQVPHSSNMCFELYGFDILLDDTLKPWLLEVNLCPSLSSSSPFDKRIKTTLMCDVFTLIGIIAKKASKKKGINKKIKKVRDLSLDELSQDDINLLIEYEEEFTRRGGFKRVFPNENWGKYAPFFEVNRYKNYLLWRYIENGNQLLDEFLIKRTS